MSPTYRKKQKREALIKKYEDMAGVAERAGDGLKAQECLQRAEYYIRTKENDIELVD